MLAQIRLSIFATLHPDMLQVLTVGRAIAARHRIRNSQDVFYGLKSCSQCGVIKTVACFHVSRTGRSGLQSHCKGCTAKFDRKRNARYAADPVFVERRRKRQREYQRLRRQNDPSYVRNYREYQREYQSRPDRRAAKNARYRTKYADDPALRASQAARQRKRLLDRRNDEAFMAKRRAAQRDHQRERRKNPAYRIHAAVSANIHGALRDRKAGRSWESLVGFTLDDLMKHLEGQFQLGMSWDNYGLGGWEIDHIIPVSVFNFTEPEDIDFKRCWALDNLQPMWATENRSKHNKLEQPFQPALALSCK